MRSLLCHFVQQQHAAGVDRGRFRAARLFVDLSGFTAMTEALMQHGTNGAEALVAVMQVIFGALVDCVYSQGGFVARTAGDALTALFPLKGAEEEAAARALAAAACFREYTALDGGTPDQVFPSHPGRSLHNWLRSAPACPTGTSQDAGTQDGLFGCGSPPHVHFEVSSPPYINA